MYFLLSQCRKLLPTLTEYQTGETKQKIEIEDFNPIRRLDHIDKTKIKLKTHAKHADFQSVLFYLLIVLYATGRAPKSVCNS